MLASARVAESVHKLSIGTMSYASRERCSRTTREPVAMVVRTRLCARLPAAHLPQLATIYLKRPGDGSNG
jgi:hypothetical protein